MGVSEGEACSKHRNRSGMRRKVVECSLGEIFRNRISFTTPERAGTESWQDSGVAGNTTIFQRSEKCSISTPECFIKGMDPKEFS